MAQPSTLSIPSGLFEFERKSPGLPLSPVGTSPNLQDAESQVEYAASSGAGSPCYDKGHYQDKADVIPENPFDSESSRVLFDAIDKLQSCGVSQELAIPQVRPAYLLTPDQSLQVDPYLSSSLSVVNLQESLHCSRA